MNTESVEHDWKVYTWAFTIQKAIDSCDPEYDLLIKGVPREFTAHDAASMDSYGLKFVESKPGSGYAAVHGASEEDKELLSYVEANETGFKQGCETDWQDH